MLQSLHPLQRAGLQGVWVCFRRRLLGRPGGGDSMAGPAPGCALRLPGHCLTGDRESLAVSVLQGAMCLQPALGSPGAGRRAAGAALLLWALLRHWGAVGGLDVFLQLSSCHLACLFPDQEILGYFYYY